MLTNIHTHIYSYTHTNNNAADCDDKFLQTIIYLYETDDHVYVWSTQSKEDL